MVYNSSVYNSLLYNSTRRRAGAVARSIIQAHTGPHIQAVVGSTGGLSFISDFIIRQEGRLSPPPAAFNFPDLSAIIRGFIRGSDDLSVFIRAQQVKDLPAKIFVVDHLPDLLARIVPLVFTDISAAILGMLAEANLLARLQGTEFVNLPAQVSGLEAPTLRASIGAHSPANLRAIIWAPAFLLAAIRAVQRADLPASITSFSVKNLGGRVFSFSAPHIIGVIKALQQGQANLGASSRSSTQFPDLGASIIPVAAFLAAVINPTGAFQNLSTLISPTTSAQKNLTATIQHFSPADLLATISFFAAKNLTGSITALGAGTHDKFLPAFIQSLNSSNLSAILRGIGGVSSLSAFIQSTTMTSNLRAVIRVDETFITTILNIATLVARDLRASIGNPSCDGGSASTNLSAFAHVQHATNLSGFIQSFFQGNLGASINSSKIFHTFDTINVNFSRRNTKTKKLRATDTLTISYSPFRGKTLGALIVANSPSVSLAATINATFPLPRVTPFVSSITAADLRREDLNIQEVRLEMEGNLTEFLYVNGTQDAFILDANEQWKINIQSFIPIAENLFGDFAAARVCRVANLQGFATLDEAVRFCIGMVLGLQGQTNLSAFIKLSGFFTGLNGRIGVVRHFSDMQAVANRVFPFDMLANISSSGGFIDLNCLLLGSSASASDLIAIIDPSSNFSLGATITGI